MTPGTRASALGRLLLAILAAGIPPQGTAAEVGVCDAGRIALFPAGEPQIFAIEIADDPAEQAHGLMFRPALPADAGMLFVFDPPRPARFWMHNTMIPLDMIFIADSGRVESIAERTDTYSQRVSRSEGPVRAVLELNGGTARRLGIAAGTQAQHPAFRAAPEEFRCGD